MQKTTTARNEICPLLDALILQLDAEGQATQKAHFKRIRTHLYLAEDSLELTHPIMDLTTSMALGFDFSNNTSPLVQRILEKSVAMVAELEGVTPQKH